MDKTLKIRIPKPCFEDWNKMGIAEKGKFCFSCEKIVIDFTSMNSAEISNYITENKNVCGKFLNSQIDSEAINIPYPFYEKQSQNFSKLFFYSLLFAMGSSLFSCNKMDSTKTSQPKITIDSIENSNQVLGEIIPDNIDSAEKNNPKENIGYQKDEVEIVTMGVVDISSFEKEEKYSKQKSKKFKTKNQKDTLNWEN